MTKLDLMDAYFAVPIHHTHHQYLRFSFQGKCYQFICLLFGLSSAHWVFTKTLKPALALLRKMGVHLVYNIDDILAESQELAKNHVEARHSSPPTVSWVSQSSLATVRPRYALPLPSFVPLLESFSFSSCTGSFSSIATVSTVSHKNFIFCAGSSKGKMNATSHMHVIPPPQFLSLSTNGTHGHTQQQLSLL